MTSSDHDWTQNYDPFGRADFDRDFHIDDQAGASENAVFDQIGAEIAKKYRGNPGRLEDITTKLAEAIKKGKKTGQDPATILGKEKLGFLIEDISRAQGQVSKQELGKIRVKGIRFHDSANATESLESVLSAIRNHK